MFTNRVRTTVQLTYKGEVRDLPITFGLIDKVRGQVAWEQIAVDFDKPDPVPNFTLLAKFVYANLKEAGFEPDLDDIYEEIIFSDENQQSYIELVTQLIMAYMPQGSKKKEQKKVTKTK